MGHATQRLARAQEKKSSVEAAFAAGTATEEQVVAARKANWTALVEYASTGAGSEALRAQWAQIGDPADLNAKTLQGAIDDGATLAQANRRAENEFRASQGKAPLSTPVPLTTAQSSQIELQARLRAEQEAARAADPMGLRAEQGGGAAPGSAQAAPRGLPVQPPTGLPTAPPQPTAAAAAREERAEQAARAREERAEQARAEREERAAETQRLRDERAAEAAQVRAERAAEAHRNKTWKTETRRLEREAAAEVKMTKKWLTEVGTTRFTAPSTTWSGPDRWRGEPRATRKENKAALQAGQAKYGAAFNDAVRRYAGEYSPAEVLSVCDRLESQGYDRITGRVRPNEWYSGYDMVSDARIADVRQEHFSRAFKAQEAQAMASRYVAANLNGVLWRARAARPESSGGRGAGVVELVRFRFMQAFVRRTVLEN